MLLEVFSEIKKISNKFWVGWTVLENVTQLKVDFSKSEKRNLL